MLAIIGYILSIVVGLSLGLIGGGGSILTVPILYYFFGTEPELATAYSLFIVGATSAVGAFKYHRQDLVDIKTGVIFAIPAFLGVYATRLWIIPALPDIIFETGFYTLTKGTLIMGAFAIVMVMASVAMIRRQDLPGNGKATASADHPVSIKLHWVFFEGLVVGGVTGFVGAGGGFLIIPVLVIFAGLPMKLAVGTSLMIISAKSLFGFTGDIMAGRNMDWIFLTVITLLAILGIFAGARLAKFIPGKKLEPVFGWFVLVMGIFILIRESI